MTLIKYRFVLFLQLLLFLVQNVFSANVLIISAVTSHSHSLYHQVLAKELVKYGHNITLLIPDYDKSYHNYTIIQFDGVYEKFGIKYDINNLFKENSFSTKLFDWWTQQCTYELESNGFKQINEYGSNSFDLIIIDVSTAIECFYPLINKFESTPIIGTSPLGMLPWLNVHTGDWLYPSITPFYSLSYSDKMVLFERFHNFYVTLYLTLYRIYYTRPLLLNLIRPFYGVSANYSTNIDKQMSIFLINMNANIGFPRPITPNVIPVAGLHIKLHGHLPQNIKQFLDEALEGVILFSLGSNIRSDFLNKTKQEMLLKAFTQLPYKVLWKWESDHLPGKPNNVMICKWLPQSDVLNHSNVKLFFTHGGELSIQEAIHFQKPIIGIPFFLDQKYNLNRVSTQGFGIKLDFMSLTVKIIVDSIHEVIKNPKYTENVKRLSSVFRDQPQTPLERAIFWIEYVIRHKGAKELEPASLHMNFYQTYCLDIILTTLSIISLITFMAIMVFRKCFVFIRMHLNVSKQKEKKQ